MDWSAIAAIGEILGAIGVIVSLTYLGIQIRQNLLWLKASIVKSAGNRTVGAIRPMMRNSR